MIRGLIVLLLLAVAGTAYSQNYNKTAVRTS